MRPHLAWSVRPLAGLLAVALASAVAVLAAAPPAAAHGTLAVSTPAEGATVTEPPAAVELYFTEKVASNAYFTVTAPGGGRVDNGWSYGSPKPLEKPVREYFLVGGKFEPREYSTGFPAVVALAHLPAVGQYSVSYLSVASDGEAVRGTMSFRYEGGPTPAPRGWSPPTNQPDPALVAAVEQHGTSGHGSTSSGAGAPVAAATSVPPAAAPVAESGEEGGPGWLAWTGWAVAIAAAVAGFVGWRRRPAPAARARTSAGPSRQRGGSRPGGKGGGRGTAGRKATPAGPSASSGKGGGARKAGAEVTAESAPASAVDDAAPATAGGLSNTRLALLAGGLVVALLAGFGLGRMGTGGGSPAGATATVPAGGASGPALSAGDGHQHPAGTGPHSHPGDASAGQATGTAVSASGYTLQPAQRAQAAGATADYTFRIVGTDRRAATRFVVVHEKPLHLIVVGRDLSGYQHLHPTMAPDGTWSVPLKLARAGGYRIYADFSVTSADGSMLPLVLGVDHLVPGAHTPAALPSAAARASVGPFAVSMEGTPTVGVTAPMFFRISRTGAPGPAQLERYLGAYGHLVVVREGDLGFVHVHPEPELVDGAVKFWLTAPSAGRYRAFLDFQVGGKVRTAEYTLDVP
ncbi:copper resistance protein CopC [Phytohabitans kaempferiae]|uniref:Copper resistance protein CopC n=1 Tax=Phytohabitans kaempferiae TaxID=1620943 RepID=A0ABV6LYY5_9ACTN